MTTLVDNPTGLDIATIVGRDSDSTFVDGLGQIAADLARDAASSYCRGVGFENEDTVPASLRHVIILRGVRFASNYLQLQRQQGDGTLIDYGPGADGFTIQELVSLDEYRKTACSI